MQASNRSAREIARIFSSGDGDLNPEYQRGSVWSEDQRMALVRSWLMGVPIPSIVINDRIFGPWPKNSDGPVGEKLYSAIDGKQRIETAIAWFDSAFAIPASWIEPQYIESTEETEDGSYVRFSGLTLAGRRHQQNRFMLPTVEARAASLQEEAELYLLLNGAGTPQSDDAMANAARVAEKN
jgi:hypothetical protein